MTYQINQRPPSSLKSLLNPIFITVGNQSFCFYLRSSLVAQKHQMTVKSNNRCSTSLKRLNVYVCLGVCLLMSCCANINKCLCILISEKMFARRSWKLLLSRDGNLDQNEIGNVVRSNKKVGEKCFKSLRSLPSQASWRHNDMHLFKKSP